MKLWEVLPAYAEGKTIEMLGRDGNVESTISPYGNYDKICFGGLHSNGWRVKPEPMTFLQAVEKLTEKTAIRLPSWPIGDMAIWNLAGLLVWADNRISPCSIKRAEIIRTDWEVVER